MFEEILWVMGALILILFGPILIHWLVQKFFR